MKGDLAKLVALGCWVVLAESGIVADWPQWRGPARNGITSDALPAQFSASPAQLWKRPIARGYASPVVSAGKLVFLDNAGGKETAHCLEAATGHEIWATPFAEDYADEFEPGPRCTPVVDGDRVYVQSCKGEFRCLGMKDGGTRWRFNFSDYGTFWVPDRNSGVGSANRRGNTGSPVVDAGRIFVQVGSTNGAGICAFDKETGKLLWKSQDDLTCYTSPVVGTLAGKRQMVTATCEGLLSLDVESGDPLWRVRFRTGANRNVLTPVLDGDTVTFASHTMGMRRDRVAAGGGALTATGVWLNKQLRVNLSTPVLIHGYLYGLGPNRDYMCVDAASGVQKWSQPGFDAVASSISDGRRLLVATDAGEMLLLDPNPEKYAELGRFQASGKTFSHPAYANGVLYVRDSRELAAWPLGPAAGERR
jgi:outer membrane protein assembly factor BamB